MKTNLRRFIKNSFVLLLLVLISSLQSKAQYVITQDIKTPYEKDSVVLFLNAIRGTVQWEISGDLIAWKSLAGQTHDTLMIHVDSSAYYRAVITEGTCAPLYSDTVLIAELFDERDQQFYDIVKIGNQWWMAENLNFRPNTGSWFYKNDSASYAYYGRLYNWHSADYVCPSGWHLPSDREWIMLEIAAGLDPSEAYNTEWRADGVRDELIHGGTTGFDFLYAGFRTPEELYNGGKIAAIFWTATQANTNEHWYRGFNSSFSGSHRIFLSDEYGFSVRCVKNDVPLVYTDSVYQVSDTSVMIQGTLFDSQGGLIINKGFCWNTQPDPTIAHDRAVVFDADSSFNAHILDLQSNTTYYIRAYASNSAGVGYGSTILFTTPKPIPLLNTITVSSITTNSAQSGGTIINSKGLQITGRGVCWSTGHNPTVNHSKTSNGTGTGSYISNITGLSPNTLYYLRAYVTTPEGPYYGNELAFETIPVNETGILLDIRNGKTYGTVKIGYQWWMAQNLDFYTASGSSYYGNDSVRYSEGGRLYNTLTAQSVCPSAWHLPADSEWKVLERTLGMDPRVLDNTDWRGTDQGAKLFEGASWGFDASFAGMMYLGNFYGNGSIAAYWSSTQYQSSGEYWYRGINIAREDIHREKYGNNNMHSVRCVMNDIPIVITDSVSAVGENTANAFSTILSDGGRPITVKGVCWSKNPNPTTANTHTSDGSGNPDYTSALTGLDQYTTYYLRAYATNDQGTSYGNEITFVTLRAFPLVTTASVSAITSGSAACGGEVTNSKGFSITARGICWSTTAAPTVVNSHTTNGTGTGVFTSSITGLLPNTKYYVRAYATSIAGTGYGIEVSFKTSFEYATGTYTDSRDGKIYGTIMIGNQQWMAENLSFYKVPGSSYYNNDSVGFHQYGRMYNWQTALNSCAAGWHLPGDEEWKTLEIAMGMNSSVVNNTGWRGTTEANKLVEGGTSGFEVKFGGQWYPSDLFREEGVIGTFWTSTQSDALNAWYRGFNISHGDIHRDNYQKEFKFSIRCLKNELPVLTTAAASGITDTSAYSGGTISYDGGVPVIARGVCWGLTHNPTISGDTTLNGTATGSFVSFIKGLSPGKTCYVRAYATNIEGTAYGNEVSVTTLTSVPRVTTSTVASITDTTAVCGGNVTSDGGLTVTARGVCWSIAQNPTIASDTTRNGSGTGTYISTLKHLLPNTTYYVRAYATNSLGTGYGNQITFATQTALPRVTTATITAITESTATGGGNVTSDGGLTVTARGICWSISVNPTTANSHTTNGTGTGSFTGSLTSLSRNTRYYVKAYATNTAGTSYGDTISFYTLAELPVLTTTTETSITDSSAISGGTITNDGGAPVLSRGICWSTLPNPKVESDDTTLNGNGTGSFTSSIRNLTDRTVYYIKAYAINKAGVGYGQERSFTTAYKTGSLTDARDNQVYSTVKIGTNWWLAENLNYSAAGSAYYDSDSLSNAETYGRLYTWSAMMNGQASSDLNPSSVQGICPAGWHIPGNTEWTEFITPLGGAGIAGSALKETGTTHWGTPNSDATNESGFTARPAGRISSAMISSDITNYANFWTATETDATTANVRVLSKTSASVTADNTVLKDNHLSVRCKKD
jgi:uncharacterized protein (TIGR02145 family)